MERSLRVLRDILASLLLFPLPVRKVNEKATALQCFSSSSLFGQRSIAACYVPVTSLAWKCAKVERTIK